MSGSWLPDILSVCSTEAEVHHNCGVAYRCSLNLNVRSSQKGHYRLISAPDLSPSVPLNLGIKYNDALLRILEMSENCKTVVQRTYIRQTIL